jgi:Domain of unknown function (DUF4062)
MDKRFQVFVSSTYADLKEERQKVIQAVIEMDCIPAGMELFPAFDEEQFQFIKRVIDDCDYYLLIIGGRYGSVTEEGISYTEKEFDYAVSIGLRVVALVHENPDMIPYGKSEQDPQLRARLNQFREKVTTGRMVKLWTSAEQLPAMVVTSLATIIKVHPAVGWIRADKAGNVELLTEINELRKENDQLRATATEFKPLVENLAGLDDKVTISGSYHRKGFTQTEQWFATLTWAEIFATISPYLVRVPNDDAVKSILNVTGFERSGVNPDYNNNLGLHDQIFRTVAVQLEALGLVKVKYMETTAGSMGLFWGITPPGQRLMIELRTVKRSPQQIGKTPDAR